MVRIESVRAVRRGESRRRVVEGVAGVKILKMALTPKQDEGVILWALEDGHMKYATHQFDPKNHENWYWGHYFDVWDEAEQAEMLADAEKDFAERAKRIGAKPVPIFAAAYAPLVRALEGQKDESRCRSRKRPVRERRALKESSTPDVSIEGTITLGEGPDAESKFDLSVEYGWNQWGATPGRLDQTVDLMDAMQDALNEFARTLEDIDDEEEDVDESKIPRSRRALKESHTPGPWEYTKTGFVRAGGTYIAEVLSGPDCPDVPEVSANAALIAAAPELLAALAALLSNVESGDIAAMLPNNPGSYAGVKAARAAIAKAEGR